MIKYGPHDFTPRGARRILALAPVGRVTDASLLAWMRWLKTAEDFMNAAQEYHNNRPGRGVFVSPGEEDVASVRKMVRNVRNWLHGLTADGGRRVGSNSAMSLFYGG
jgi:hypothetical protein